MTDTTMASQRRLERNQERILKVALELFRLHGVRKTSIHDIAHKAGVSPATVYNHFGNKEELVRAAADYFLRTTLAEYQEIIQGELPFMEKLQQMILYKSDMLGRESGEFLQKLVSDAPEMRNLFESAYIAEIRQCVEDFFEEGKKKGYISSALSTASVIRYAEIIRRGIAAGPGMSENPQENVKLIEEITPLFLYGLLGKQP